MNNSNKTKFGFYGTVFSLLVSCLSFGGVMLFGLTNEYFPNPVTEGAYYFMLVLVILSTVVFLISGTILKIYPETDKMYNGRMNNE